MLEISLEEENYLINLNKILYVNAYENGNDNYVLDICFTGYENELFLEFENKTDCVYYYNKIKITLIGINDGNNKEQDN